MNVEQVFLVIHGEHFISVALAGYIFGFLFVGKMSAHLSVPEYGLRQATIGTAFLACMTVIQVATGASWWEAWIGVLIAFYIYTLGIMAGLWSYDRRLKREIERQLGQSLRINPRGILKP